MLEWDSLCHAHPLGALYDTPHGVANAIILPVVMEYNASATGTKYKDIAEVMGVDTTGMDQETYRKAAVDAVKKLSQDWHNTKRFKRNCKN